MSEVVELLLCITFIILSIKIIKNRIVNDL